MKIKTKSFFSMLLTLALVISMVSTPVLPTSAAAKVNDNIQKETNLSLGGCSEIIHLEPNELNASKTKLTKKISKSGLYKSELSGISLKIYNKLAKTNWKKSTKISMDISTNYNYYYNGEAKIYSDILKGYWAFVNDKPELYWLSGCDFRYWYDYQGYIYNIEITPNIYYEGILKEDKAVRKALTKAYKTINKKRKSKSDYQTVVAIYNYIIRLVSYGDQYNFISTEHTITGALLSKYNNTGVCEAYAKLFKIMCDHYKIKCVLVQGNNHMWNYVQIKGHWYLVDATWDDQGKTGSKQYFLKGRSSIYDHSPYIEYHSYSGVSILFYPPALYKKDYR